MISSEYQRNFYVYNDVLNDNERNICFVMSDKWQDLNERQQIYMQKIYETDQLQEQGVRMNAVKYQRSPPADEWRWIEYANTVRGHTPIKQRLIDADVVDPGTGSTFEALETRGYILLKYDRASSHPRADIIIYIRLTTKGRRLVRQALQCYDSEATAHWDTARMALEGTM